MFREHHNTFASFSSEMIIPGTLWVSTVNSEQTARQNDTLRNDICMVHVADLQGLETLNGTFRITMQQRTMDGGFTALLKCK
jgi:hypothetical protein